MGLFQKSVFNNFVKRFAYNAKSELNDAFARFNAYFGDFERQASIAKLNESQYQEGFLINLFVKIFGYVLPPEKDYNLIPEYQNASNKSKKADAVILHQGEVIGVIELKSTKTHLDLVTGQAFGYKNAHEKAVYVITSNFQFIRFYHLSDNNFIEFDLFNLTYEEFEQMYALFCPTTLLSDKVARLKADSAIKQEEITLDFYEKYQNFKDALCLHIGANNKQIDTLLIFEKAQKLLDRIIFMYFASSRGLLPTNHISLIIKEWKEL